MVALEEKVTPTLRKIADKRQTKASELTIGPCLTDLTSLTVRRPTDIQLLQHSMIGDARIDCESDGLRDLLLRPNQRWYPGQLILVVAYDEG